MFQVTAADVQAQQTQIELSKTQKLDEIANATNATIAAILIQYKNQIATSTGFGYVAASKSIHLIMIFFFEMCTFFFSICELSLCIASSTRSA